MKSVICLNMRHVFFTIIILTSLCSFSQRDSVSIEKKVLKALKYDGGVAIKSVGNYFTEPLRWKSDDFLTAGGIIAGTGLLYLSDNTAQKFFQKQNKGTPQVFNDFGFYFGKPQNFFMLSAGIYGFGLLTDNERVRRIGVLVITSGAISGGIQTLSKSIFGRERPQYGGSHDNFEPFSNKPEFHSFPSGHSTLSFSIAHSIAKQFDNFWVKAGIYSIGSIAPISRMLTDAHWISDVGMGIVLSIVVVDNIDNFMKKEKLYDFNKPKQISWRLKAGAGTIGIVGTF